MPKHLTTGSAQVIQQIDQILKQAAIPPQNRDLEGATIGALASIVCFTRQTGPTPCGKKAYLALVSAIYDGMVDSVRDALDAENIPIQEN